MVLSDDMETAVRKVQDEGRVWRRCWDLLWKRLVFSDSIKVTLQGSNCEPLGKKQTQLFANTNRLASITRLLPSRSAYRRQNEKNFSSRRRLARNCIGLP